MLFSKKATEYTVYYRYKNEADRKIYGDGWYVEFEHQTKQEAKEAIEGLKYNFGTWEGGCRVDIKVVKES